MVTLTGPGGIGKTRLALRALGVLADEFPDNVRYIELADITSPDLVVARVASVVGVAEEKGRALLDTLAAALGPRTMLLALDNCEHLLESCARLCQRLLAAAPDLCLIVTSREPLRVAGERIWQVPPLAVRSADGSAAEAVRLFTERAVAIAPGFALTQANADAVAAICRSLDGIPLGIELAAARVRALSVEQIRMRVADRFDLLTTGDRAAAPRQQTLRAAIDWSHDLLTGREQALLRRYHDTLLRMGVTGFSFDDCWQAYRFAVLCGLFVAIFTTGGMDVGNRRGQEMVRAAVRRVDAAVSELQVGDLLPR